MDVFIGTFTDQQKYGIPMNSYLYLNDGKGNFTFADIKTINLLQIGMVTSATFTDLNKDGWPDLVVTGEWMGMKIFMNDHGKFTEKEVPNSTGLWQSVYATDINGDGYPDLLAGNWGHNSKLSAGKNGPLKLYVKDFDFSGRIEQIMCYTIDGNEYTFLPKDALEQSLPVLKKAYLTYDEVAGKTVQYMFYDLFKNAMELKAETLGSSCFINDGKGNFKRTDLPDGLQMAPVFSFATAKAGVPGSYIGGGNFYGVLPYEGRYDALMPTFFSFDREEARFSQGPLLPDVRGEIRDLKWLRSAKYGEILITARNNDSLLFFQNAGQ
jgi:enediyne biosynthesis protein E4